MPYLEKHLEFIQHIIIRMGQNSFYIKGWSAALATAFFAFIDNEKFLIMLAVVVPLLLFWVLDGYFLWQERRFRILYDFLVENPEKANFNMNNIIIDQKDRGWVAAVFSKTLIIFHLSITVAATMFVIGVYFTS